ncbi:LysR family transcriptional regulator [Pseudodesulfovibrio cashew]|uniref:LysR family transcriptional regulator n=1 Tax=Pseudodesulfovibrio cashew TaxID=2678688 RepID=A0A6I6J7L3_9BACT|nr:LysR family transcriptional regulator [Pseudodesulfovibrio cashew]QGY38806.1 LysR family transcriptional regulator [Pseudodesulfovibrio cashew]
MELRQLRYFIAVAEELNFTRAAERCHIAQPPLSQQIKKLEEELEIRLFDRTNKRVRLTAEGESFLATARSALDGLTQGVENARMVSRGEVGLLRIGFLNSSIQTPFPDALTDFRKQYPGIILDIREMDSFNQAKALHEGELDVGICHDWYAREPWLASRLFYYDDYYLAVHRDDPVAARGIGRWKDLDGEPFIMFSRRHYPASYDLMMNRFRQFGVSPCVVQEAKTHHTKLALVAAGMGVGFVPERMHEVCPTQVRLVPFEWEGAVRKGIVMLAWRDGPLSPALSRFLELMGGYCQEEKLLHAADGPLASN